MGSYEAAMGLTHWEDTPLASDHFNGSQSFNREFAQPSAASLEGPTMCVPSIHFTLGDCAWPSSVCIPITECLPKPLYALYPIQGAPNREGVFPNLRGSCVTIQEPPFFCMCRSESDP